MSVPAGLRIRDPRGARRRWAGPAWLRALEERLLNDPRDAPFLGLMAAMTAVLLPFAVVLYLPGVFRWWLGALYLAVNLGLFLDRFILMLHNTRHRRLFRPGVRLDWVIEWVLGPLAGETPWTYAAHHLGMHHPENNLAADGSSTLRYRRDAWTDFLRYWGRFLVLGVGSLVLYLRRKGRRKLARRAVVGEVSYLLAVGALWCVDWRATLVVFLAPLAFSRFAMMAGNWAQHAFVDPRDPASPYRNSITVINTRYNRRCFNDGYHIGHHLKPTRHWSEMPDDFLRNVDVYRREGALVFDGIDYFQIWALLMVNAYGTLARHVVVLGDERRSHGEIVALLRERTAPIAA